MNSLNIVIIQGNLARDPELRQTASGVPLCQLRLAINERYKNKAGEDVESTVFVDVVAWGKQAEASAKYLSKGSAVIVEGRLQYEAWEKDGEKKSRLRIRADRVHFLGKPKPSNDEAAAPTPAPNEGDRAGDIPVF